MELTILRGYEIIIVQRINIMKIRYARLDSFNNIAVFNKKNFIILAWNKELFGFVIFSDISDALADLDITYTWAVRYSINLHIVIISGNN